MPKTGASVIFRRRLERPFLALHTATTGDAALKAIVRLLKNAAPCDFVNVFLRNFLEDERHVAYRLIDSRGRDFGPEMLHGVFFAEHPGMPTLLANPGIRFINTREILPPEKVLHKTRFYREVMEVVGFRHAVGMFFWRDPPHVPETIFSICRGEGRSDFNDTEVALFDRLYPHIDAVLRRVRAIEQERTVHREMRTLARQTRRPACVLNWDLKITDANQAAKESGARWNLGSASGRLKPTQLHLPEEIRNACLQLREDWIASLRHDPSCGQAKSCTVQHPADPQLRAAISLHLPSSSPTGVPNFLIEFIRHKAAPNTSREREASVSALNSRERELVELICKGLSNQEIATITGRAVGTIKNSLHQLYLKLQVRSRGMLIALLAGMSG